MYKVTMKEFEGWSTKTTKVQKVFNLPSEAYAYFEKLAVEALTGFNVDIYSINVLHTDTILRELTFWDRMAARGEDGV